MTGVHIRSLLFLVTPAGYPCAGPGPQPRAYPRALRAPLGRPAVATADASVATADASVAAASAVMRTRDHGRVDVAAI